MSRQCQGVTVNTVPGQNFDPPRKVDSVYVKRCFGLQPELIDGCVINHKCVQRPLTPSEFKAWLPTSGLSLDLEHANPIEPAEVAKWPAPEVINLGRVET